MEDGRSADWLCAAALRRPRQAGRPSLPRHARPDLALGGLSLPGLHWAPLAPLLSGHDHPDSRRHLSLPVSAGARTLKVLLSFAVGGLLGDVFLHLLPEAWASRQKLGE